MIELRYDYVMVGITLSFGVILLGTSIYSFTRKENLVGLRLIGIMALLEAIYCLSYSGFLMRNEESAMLMYDKISYFGISYLALFWLLIARQQKESTRKFSRKLFLLLMIIPVATNLTNLLYALPLPESFDFLTKAFYTGHTLIEEINIGVGYNSLVFTKGYMYYVMIGYNTILLIAATIHYILSIKHGGFVKKSNLVILGGLSLLGVMAQILAFFIPQTTNGEFASIISAIITLIAFAALYSYELFHLTPMAYKRTFMHSFEPIFVFDRSFNVIKYNQAAISVFTSTLDFRNRINISDFRTNGKGSLKEELAKTGETECEFSTGVYYRVKLDPLYRSENRIMGYLLTYYNITEHKNELKRMEQMAAYDELTKIVNRRYFFKSAIAAFDEANANNEPISVIMFDLDNFKEVNDVFGHQAGDYVLETMVKIFKPKILPSDIFGRYGGEEFILFRKNIDAEASFRLANELCRLLASTPFIYEKRRIKTSASFGVVGSQSSIDKSLEAYIRLADNALYVSKSRGKNQVTLG